MRKFLIKISYTILPMWIFLFGLTIYYGIYVKPKETKELGGLGKIPFGNIYENFYKDDIPEKPLYKIARTPDEIKNTNAKIINIGDSFSLTNYSNTTVSYPNFMQKNNIDVCNYEPHMMTWLNPFQSTWDLLNLGFLDSSSAKIVIIESVERALISRITGIDFNKKQVSAYQKPKQSKSSANTKTSSKKVKQKLLPNNPLTEAKNYFALKFGLGAQPVRYCKLTKDYFADNFSRDLYFFQDDITWGTTITSEEKSKTLENLEKIFKKAEERGLKLIILIAVDKYDLYQNYIENNPYPPKTINEDFEELTNGDKRIIYSKKILQPEIIAGEKDIFYVNDSHWSVKGSKIVGNYLTKMFE